MKPRLTGAAAVALLCVWLCSPPQARAWVSDPWITAKVKIALLTTLGWTARDIDVDTVDGRVTLHGDVPSAVEKAKSVEVARSVEGVGDIRDLLKVEHSKPPKSHSDAKLRTRVQHALDDDVKSGGSQLSVGSVKDGVVQLTGKVANAFALLRGIEVAGRVRGVRRVQSDVDTGGTGDVDIWTRHELRQSGRGIIDVATDLWLAAEVRLRLLADPRVPALEVSIDCRDQKITLFGTVTSRAEKKAAKEDVEAVPGVRDVENELQIVPAEQRAEVQAKDAELEKGVSEAILKRPEMKRAAIRVAVSNGVVRLTGTVPSYQHRLAAATTARTVSGVRAVDEALQVTSITEEVAPTTPVRHSPGS